MMEKQEQLTRVENALAEFWHFLSDYLPLANAHTTDFIVANQWQRFVPPGIAEELLALSSSQLSCLPSGRLPNFCPADKEKLQPNVLNGDSEDSCRIHKKEKSTDCECLQPKTGELRERNKSKINQETDKYNSSFSFSTVSVEKDTNLTDRKQLPRDQLPQWSHKDLKSFILSARQHSLPCLEVTTDLNQVLSSWKDEDEKRLVIANIMSSKKSHEVEVMADVCATLAKHCKTNQVVDIGSGKGYLSSQLALMHHLPVLGIDSSQTNTDGASVRIQRLSKHWDGLVRNAREEQEMGVRIRRGKNYRGKQKKKEARGKFLSIQEHDSVKEESAVANDDLANIATLFNCSDSHFSNSKAEVIPEAVVNDLHTVDGHSKHPAEIQKEMNSETNQKPDTNFNQVENTMQNYYNVQTVDKVQKKTNKLFWNSSSDHNSTLLQEDVVNERKGEYRESRKAINSHSSLYVPVTEFVTSDTNILELLTDKGFKKYVKPTGISEEKDLQQSVQSDNICLPPYSDAESSVLLTGLHACGNLSSSILRLFVNNPCIRAVCNVGCCYNHLDEEFVRGPFEADDAVFTEFGFPLSLYLRSKHCQLGRNARMLAAQSPDRMARDNKVSQKAMFWRAILQVILCDIMGEERDDWHVGRIAGKCSDFVEYVHKAFTKLKMTHKLTDEEIQQYVVLHSSQEAKLTAFFQLRATLGPCVEGLILLDRLAFLLEQNCTADAHLVQMFDPVTSPRCYGLIATRKRYDQASL